MEPPTAQPTNACPQSVVIARDSSLRPTRSRKDRPCDRCRKQKQTCQIVTRGQPCISCSKADKPCTFASPSVNRHRPTPASRLKDDTLAALHPVGGPTDAWRTHSATAISSTWKGKAKGKPSHPLLALLDNLDRDFSRESSVSDDPDYPSLDLETNDQEESQYLGSFAFAHLTLSVPSKTGVVTSPTGSSPGDTVAFRQVADPRRPVFFLRNPSKVYGLSNTAFEAEKAYDTVNNLLRAEHAEYPARLLQIFLDKILPALPMLNKVRLEAACFAWQGGGTFPHTVLTGILVHSAVYIPALRHKCKELWAILLHLLDNEFRQPRLQTLQLALLDIYGRPFLNPGGNHTNICRAIGVAQLLGLHRNSAEWRLPRWERSIRKRIWCILYIADKWNACVYGRPSNIPSAITVPLPTLEDDDWNGQGADMQSMTAFVAMCRLSVVLDSLLPLLASSDEDTQSGRTELRQAAEALTEVESGLDVSAQLSGIQSYKLCRIGVSIMICRMAFESRWEMSATRSGQAAESIMDVIGELVSLLDSLQSDDYAGYWTPWCSFQISHAAALLLRTCLKLQANNVSTERAWSLLHDLVKSLQRGVDSAWEVGEVALTRIRTLAGTLPDIPGSEDFKNLLAPPRDIRDGRAGDSSAEVLDWLRPGGEWLTGDPNLWMRELAQAMQGIEPVLS